MYYIIAATVLIIVTALIQHIISIKTEPFYPKRVWTYMESDLKPPAEYRKNIESWRKWNPDYKITVLTKKNYHSYITLSESIKDSPLIQSQPCIFKGLISLAALKEHGGIWMEPTVLLKGPLCTAIHSKKGTHFVAFHKDNCIQTWFLSSIKACKYVTMWFDELASIIQYPMVDKYSITKNINLVNRCSTVVQLSALVVLERVENVERIEIQDVPLIVQHGTV